MRFSDKEEMIFVGAVFLSAAVLGLTGAYLVAGTVGLGIGMVITAIAAVVIVANG